MRGMHNPPVREGRVTRHAVPVRRHRGLAGAAVAIDDGSRRLRIAGGLQRPDAHTVHAPVGLLPKTKYGIVSTKPPNHMRTRVGLANRIFAKKMNFVSGAKECWIYGFHSRLRRLASTCVDIGCGCGRSAPLFS